MKIKSFCSCFKCEIEILNSSETVICLTSWMFEGITHNLTFQGTCPTFRVDDISNLNLYLYVSFLTGTCPIMRMEDVLNLNMFM